MPDVLAVWSEAVGPMIAANAWPARIARDRTLYVNTSSSAWAFELSQLAPTLLERLQAALGENAPKALRLAVGHVPEPPSSDAEHRPQTAPSPTAEALQTAADLTAEITDAELRERVARAAALSLSRERSDPRV
jgi:hypothetical protein